MTRSAATKALPLAAALCLLATLALAAFNFPPLAGRVTDQAGILSAPARAALETKLKDLEDKSSIQLAVATVKSLDGSDIESFANGLFRVWKLGEAKKNNGVLFLIAPNERKMRIEVGYGLEGVLTDAVSKIIIATAVAPKFKAGDFDGGVTRGVDAIVETLSSDQSEWTKRAQRAEEPDLVDQLLPLLLFLLFVFIMTRMSRNARGGGGPIIFLPMPGGGRGWDDGGSFGGGFGGGGGFDGGFSGGGGSSGGGGASGDW
jgi:uncharacterized protein